MKIGSQAHRSSAISASNAETIVVRGHDLCARAHRHGHLHRPRLAAGHGPAAERGAAPRARRHAGGHRRARPGAERAGEPHDAGRGARGAAGRGGGRHPRLRLGDPGFGRSGGAAVRRDRGARAAASRSRRRRAPCSASCARRASPCPATAIRCTSARIRAWRGCSQWPPRPAVAGRHIEAAALVERLRAGDLRASRWP